MSDEGTEQETGSGLRAKLEEALKEQRQATELATQVLLQDQAFSLVKPEDLKGANASQLVERAKAVQAERYSAQEAVVRDVLAKQGLEGEALDAGVKQFLGLAPQEPAKPVEAEAFESLGRLAVAGQVPPREGEQSNVFGRSRIQSAFEAKN